MPFLITDSAQMLLLETVPALKITQYYGKPLRDNVYAYLRCFVQAGALHCCFTCFDEAPPQSARMTLCLQGGDMQRTLLCSVGKSVGAQLLACTAYTLGQPSPAPTALAAHPAPCSPVETGGDEQGLYWSRRTTIPAVAFRDVLGFAPQSGAALFGNLYLHNADETAFGAAFPVPEGIGALAQAGFDALPIVPY